MTAMKPQNRIAAGRKRRGWSQRKLAEELGVHWITLSKIERGRQKLTWDRIVQIARSLEVEPSELLPSNEQIARVWIVGELDDDGLIKTYPDDQPQQHHLMSSIYDDPASEWLIIKGNGLYPNYQEGDLLRITWDFAYDQRRSSKRLARYIGRLCLVVDQSNQQHLGFLGRGPSPTQAELHFPGRAPRRLAPKRLAQVTVALMPALP